MHLTNNVGHSRRNTSGPALLLIGLLAVAGCGEPAATSNLSATAASNPELAAKAKADAAKADAQSRKAEAAALKKPLAIDESTNP